MDANHGEAEGVAGVRACAYPPGYQPMRLAHPPAAVHLAVQLEGRQLAQPDRDPAHHAADAAAQAAAGPALLVLPVPAELIQSGFQFQGTTMFLPG